MKKNRHIHFKVSTETYETWRKKSESIGLSVNQMIVLLMNNSDVQLNIEVFRK